MFNFYSITFKLRRHVYLTIIYITDLLKVPLCCPELAEGGRKIILSVSVLTVNFFPVTLIGTCNKAPFWDLGLKSTPYQCILHATYFTITYQKLLIFLIFY